MIGYEDILNEVEHYEGKKFIDPRENKIWSFVGILVAPEDLYYELIRDDGKRILLSMAGDIFSHGFIEVGED